MTLPISQANRALRATTPLGGDALVAVGLTGEEEVSRPFLFTVDFVSTNQSVTAASVLGKPMTLHIPLDGGGARAVHGLVRKFSTFGRDRTDDLAHYRAEVVPALWFMSLSSNCRTFENQSVLDIAEAVCKQAGVTNVKRRVTAAPPALPYVVQYRESDLAFVSRLLEDAGLFYTFEHEEDKHTLVFSDARGGSIPACAMASAKVQPRLAGGQPQADVIVELTRHFAVHSASVSFADHDLLRADNAGKVSSASPGARGEWFDFLGDLGPNDSAGEAKLRIELEEAGHDVFRGTSTCAAFQAGTRVEVTGGPAGASGTELHLLRVTHTLEGGDVFGGSGMKSSYENTFVCIPASVRYRPERITPRPSVRGTQTAKVVGSGGTGEIDVDADGRILLQFPWDRGEGKDGKSKHRVHVASAWAGTGWGFMQIPRVGQEVLVEFLEGDPERPIVTGRVYNSAHKPPYELPANKTQSGWKSRTLGGGSDNFNELRFEDKKGEEHVFAQAEKDLTVLVKNDEVRDVQHDRTTTITNNDTRTVKEGNDEHTVEKGNQSVTVSKGNQTITVSEGDQTIEVAKGNRTVTVDNNEKITIHAGNRDVTLDQGNDTLKVKMGNLTMDVSLGNIEIKAGAGKVAIEAMQELSLKVGTSSIVLSPTGVEIKGMNVKSEATVQAEMKGLMTKVEGSVQTQVKGAMTQVNGDGMVMVKGGVTMIN
ncbi:MAG TPA: type VI secretion system tip protein TssI/VgrG [Gemmatimonadaceae bacterium]|jgi:type VI secretion system secreted protein VgrG|nr:type VI secretion system tip protein TssI/VgrG [Gemmatimonadaceae bacterium]